MSKYVANPKQLTTNITRPGESKEYVGSRNVTELLPDIFKTTVNKQFLNSTLEQLMSSGSLQAISNYIGRKSNSDVATEIYTAETNRLADKYQFVPGAVNKDIDGNISDVFSYDDLINSLKYNEALIDNHSMSLNEAGYTLDLPINYDMFTNYHRYYYAVNALPTVNIAPVGSHPITIEDIVGQTYYTASNLSSTVTSVELQNGMRIKFSPTLVSSTTQTVPGNVNFNSNALNALAIKVYVDGIRTIQYTYNSGTGLVTLTGPTPALGVEIQIFSYYTIQNWQNGYAVDDIYVVAGVGSPDGIRLIKQYVSHDGNYGEYKKTWHNETIYNEAELNSNDSESLTYGLTPKEIFENNYSLPGRDYVVEDRASVDQSSWSRTNLWIHEETARDICTFNNVDIKDYLIEGNRAVRPIIEYKPNIEKFNFGKNHLTSVDFIIDCKAGGSNIDPQTDIIGQTNYNLAEQIVTSAWNNQGYTKGTLVYRDIGGERSYWDCIETHADPQDPLDNTKFWRHVQSKNFETADFVLFINCDNVDFNNKIFEVNKSLNIITLSERFNFDGTNSAEIINNNDKVVCIVGYNTVVSESLDTLVYSGSEWYWNGNDWVYGQQKDSYSEGALFNMYDTDGVVLNDTAVYPDSNFTGDRIFDYGRSNNNPIDEALLFSPRYVDYGNNPGLSFDIEAGFKKYRYTTAGPNISATNTQLADRVTSLNIDGFYFYKNLNDNYFYNIWSLIRHGQPIKQSLIKTITTEVNGITVDIGSDNVSLDDEFIFVYAPTIGMSVSTRNTTNTRKRTNDISGINPTLFVSKDRAYKIEMLGSTFSDLQLINLDGTLVSSGATLSSTGPTTGTLTIDANVTFNAFKWRLISDNSITGIVYIDSNENTSSVKVYLNGEETTNYTQTGTKILVADNLAIDDVISVEWYSESDSTGTFDPADTHIYNPQNLYDSEVSFADLLKHISSQMSGIPGISGSVYGSNNYRNLPHIHEFGGTIRQQPFSTELISQLQMNNDTNIFAAVKYLGQSYRIFKKQFLQKVKELHNTTDLDIPVYEIVDRALKQINIGKVQNSAFSNSDMAMYTEYESVQYGFTNTSSLEFDLPHTINTYIDKQNHIQVYIQEASSVSTNLHWTALSKDNYSIDSNTNKIIIDSGLAINYNSNGVATIKIRWFPQSSKSFIPPTMHKIGMYRPFAPSLINHSLSSDSSIGEPVILGHDGSITARKGTNLYDRTAADFSIEDSALWDLELRIYNNIGDKFTWRDAYSSLDYKEIMPTASDLVPHTWNDLSNVLTSSFNKWKIRNNITSLTPDNYYSISNKFTWNYSSVGPRIGGWRGIYIFYFNTDRPHTHPWEMLGHNTQPSWWDTYYSWTDPTKRTALIAALKVGHYNNPADSPKYSKSYIYNRYDWNSKTLVTTTGVLNDPDTAQVVATPTSTNAEQNFVFGDWGPVEDEYRRSSDYPADLSVALLRLRPLWVTNTFFKSGKRKVFDDLPTLYNKFIGFSDIKEIGNNTSANFSYSKFNGSILESVIVKDTGSGYTISPTLTVIGNFGSGALVRPILNNQELTAVQVLNCGENYYSNPYIDVSTGTAEVAAVLDKNAIKYYQGLSNAIAEFVIFNKTTIDDLSTRFKDLTFNPLIKVGGFLNPNNQRFILESSQDKGRVQIPEENYKNILHTGFPVSETFFSAINITKVSNGYKITGFDNSSSYFKYYAPKSDSKKITVGINNGKTLFKYLNWERTELILNYNTVISTLQSLFDFILGYSEYLKDNGWITEWQGTGVSAVNWVSNANNDQSYNFIPSNFKFEIDESKNGYFDNINQKYDGVYNLIDENYKQILSNKVYITRELLNTDEPKTVITTKDENTKICGIRLYKVELEHVVVFDNYTDFDDVVYNPSIGILRNRLIWKGSRTKNWNGKLYSPGYIVNDNTIINNFDTTAREIDQFYGTGVIVNNQQLLDVSRWNAGYNKPDWSMDTFLDDNTVFEFTKSSNKYKGTRFALDAFIRNNDVYGDTSSINLYEDWAVRTGDYGQISLQDKLEFELTLELLTQNPQSISFSSLPDYSLVSTAVIEIGIDSPLLVSGSTSNDIFKTISAKNTTETSIQIEDQKSNYLTTAGTPLTTEVDYRILNLEDFEIFPESGNSQYNFPTLGWTYIDQWDNQTSYNYKDRVIYQGRVWEMLDPDGASGLNRPNDAIEVTGTITLPVIPQSGETLILDGITVSIVKSSTTITQNAVTIDGTTDIGSSPVVLHGTSLIIGTGNTNANAQTITFDNTINTVEYQDIEKEGTVSNPVILGSPTASLIIDSTTILFNDTTTTTNTVDITALQALTPATSTASTRISAIETLRSAYISAIDQVTYDTFILQYFANAAGLDIDELIAEHASGASPIATEIAALLTNDLDIINTERGTTYATASVLSGAETVDPADISATQTAMLNAGQYVDDFSNWVKANTTTVLTNSTVVATETTSTTTYNNYNLAQIIQKINSQGIANVTAGQNSGNALTITKTTLTPTIRFNLTIGVGTENATVGFQLTNETIYSQGQLTTTTPNLSLTQVIAQINAAGIPNVTAGQNPNNPNTLRITSTASSVFVGAGSANSYLGIFTGVYPATVSTTTEGATSDLTDIILAVNNANISGVTASNSNNRLQITSTNSQLAIGAGTANNTVGLISQTYIATQNTISNEFNAIGSDGNQIFREVENDPNLFNIWVANTLAQDITKINDLPGFAVFQTMDFDMYITLACAGIEDADTAELTVALADTIESKQVHNLQVGDYIFIRGSNTTPSIDGVHQITNLDQNSTNKFYIDAYIEEQGDVGNIYPLRNVRFQNYTDMNNSLISTINGMWTYNYTGGRRSDSDLKIYAFVDSDENGQPAVYYYDGIYTNNSGHVPTLGWIKVRSIKDQARNDLLENVKIYDAERRTNITTLEIWDPAKGIIPGFIDNEIDIKTSVDFANYNYTTLAGGFENTKAWGQAELGTRWWDLRTSIYLEYEQGELDYQISNWGKLFDGATVDIYEWTRSSVPPDQWSNLVNSQKIIDGVVASGEAYSITIDGETVYFWSESEYYDPINNKNSTAYFFWVKNKNTKNKNRTYSPLQLSYFLSNATDFAWAAGSGSNDLLLGNVEPFLTENSVVQLNFIDKLATDEFDNTKLLDVLSEFTLLSENSPDTTIPEYLHIKIRDSLAGFNNYSERFTYTTWNNTVTYNKRDVVIDNLIYYISLSDNNLGVSPSTDLTQSYWRRIYEYEIADGTPEDDIDIWMGQPVPNLSLHRHNRYGHLTRPEQSLYRDIVYARQNFVTALNEILADLSVFNEFSLWDRFFDIKVVEGKVTYDISRYWKYIDFVKREYGLSGELLYEYNVDQQVDRVFNNIIELNDATFSLGIAIDFQVNELALVKNVMHSDNINRSEIYKWDGSNWILQWKEKGTVEFSEELWNQAKFGHGWDNIGFDLNGFDNDTSNIINEIFDILRYHIFIGQHKVSYNKLWFQCLYQAITDNTADDFAFKTTYANLVINHPLLLNKTRYEMYNANVIEKFFNSIKPYHTKLRSVQDNNTHLDATNVEVTEIDRTSEIRIHYNDHSLRSWAGDTILQGGSFTDTLTHVDASEFTTLDNQFEYVYNANVFQQSALEGWGEELTPLDFMENIRIGVQTNLSGNTVTGDTRSFYINYWDTYRTEESSVIVDTAQTTLTQDISDTDTTIEVADGTRLPIPTTYGAGVVWINNERIEYGNLDGNRLLYCNRGTWGTSASNHTAGDVVTDAMIYIPAQTHFYRYGNALPLAYNESGVSLAVAGASTEHAFIRNAGFGTL